ncbi:MAG: family 43 glycosylhydrolase, partial [Oscillospiraceae bacterium]|nr:family 43 glycosylhydrolase [Oscillospiraceae bacterium]
MKRTLSILLAVIMMFAFFVNTAAAAAEESDGSGGYAKAVLHSEPERTYKNPFNEMPERWLTTNFNSNMVYGEGDPYIMKYNGMFYLYVSTADGNVGIKVWHSENLIDWTYGGLCVPNTVGEVARGAYAPEVYYWNGTFYLYTAAPGGPPHRVFTSDNPLGPFEYRGTPHPNDVHAIDGSLFIDDDANATKYFSHSGGGEILYRLMNDDLLTAKDGGAMYSIPGASFNRRWTEGSQIFKRNGKYYITYTGNHILSHNYRIKYAAGDSVPGMKDPENALLLCNTEEGIVGLGHNSFVVGPDLDSRYIVYHNLLSMRPERRMNIDRMIFNKEKLEVQGPTWWDMPVPKMPEFYDRMNNGSNWDTAFGDASVSNNVMTLTGSSRVLSKQSTPGDYTAEFNMSILSNPGAPYSIGSVITSYTDDKNYAIVDYYDSPNYADISIKIIKNGSVVSSGTSDLPSEYFTGISGDAELLRKITVKKEGNVFDVYIDDRLLMSCTGDLDGGKIGLETKEATAKFGYTAFSSTVNGNQDKDTLKPTNSEMDAVHANKTSRDFATGEITESGADLVSKYYKDLVADDSLTYNIQPQETSYYSVNIKAKGAVPAKADLYIDDTLVKEGVVIAESDVFSETAARHIEINKTAKEFKLVVTEGTLDLYSVKLAKLADIHDSIETQENMEFERLSGEWIDYDDRISVSTDSWAMAGYGTEYLGDYDLSANITLNRESNAGFMVRMKYATNASDPVVGIDGCRDMDYHYGYFIGLNEDGIILGKQMFNWKSLASREMSLSTGISYNLRVRVEGANIRVFLNNFLQLEYTDKDNPIMEGRIGLRAVSSSADYKDLTLRHINPSPPLGQRETVDSDAVEISSKNFRIFSNVSGGGGANAGSPGKGYYLKDGT